MELSDEALIEAHQQGDETAFGRLVRRYGDSLLGYLVKMTGNRQQAEDLFQETFSKVHQKAGTFKGQGRFKGWLYTIATNIAIDEMRKQGREPVMISMNQHNDCGESGCSESTVAAAKDETAGPLQSAVLTERKAQVRCALARLPERQRTTLILAYYQGLTYKEVAGVMGCSPGTVKTQMFRAMRTLAEILPDVEGGAE
ncbi:MAG: sigma-70 family RNA polymerase sigma factor [Sedimentisphaerales bacterium]|nr:sigma-70 family RNA polymerase sigma factor [Sedimentisphaerales bacterium]